jgi:hypothetical protein
MSKTFKIVKTSLWTIKDTCPFDILPKRFMRLYLSCDLVVTINGLDS